MFEQTEINDFIILCDKVILQQINFILSQLE